MPITPSSLAAQQLEDDLWQIDTLFQGQPGVIAAYLLIGEDGLALVDVGSAATVESLQTGVRAAGYELRDVRYLVLTHVHLDHAGAAGTLVRLAPAAQVYVHPLGAPHLIDPSKLVASATRIYGAHMEQLWGITEAVPAERVRVIEDGARIHVGRRTLTALHTPGHAVHHIVYHDARRAALFAGDVAGVRLNDIDYVRPPTPPPDLSLEDWSASLARLRALRLERLYLPHFGVAREVEAHLRTLEARLYAWGDLVLTGMRAGKTTEALARDLAAASDPELEAAAGDHGSEARTRFALTVSYEMAVQGYERYYRKQHPERLTG